MRMHNLKGIYLMMTTEDRINAYTSQRRSFKLTARQERRIQQKAARMPELVNVCPVDTCKAAGDAPCVTASGKPAKSPHKGRYELAA